MGSNELTSLQSIYPSDSLEWNHQQRLRSQHLSARRLLYWAHGLRRIYLAAKHCGGFGTFRWWFMATFGATRGSLTLQGLRWKCPTWDGWDWKKMCVFFGKSSQKFMSSAQEMLIWYTGSSKTDFQLGGAQAMLSYLLATCSRYWQMERCRKEGPQVGWARQKRTQGRSTRQVQAKCYTNNAKQKPQCSTFPFILVPAFRLPFSFMYASGRCSKFLSLSPEATKWIFKHCGISVSEYAPPKRISDADCLKVVLVWQRAPTT